MNSTTESIRKYLLGELSEEERFAAEERLLTDRAFHQEILIVEEELIEEYLEGSLTNKAGFTQYFLDNPGRAEKLQISMAFREYVSRVKSSTSESKASEGTSHSWFKTFLLGQRRLIRVSSSS